MNDQGRTPFGQRMFEAREDAGLTQEDAAKIVGMSQSALSEMETSGKRSSYTAALAEVYGYNEKYLSRNIGPKKPDGTKHITLVDEEDSDWFTINQYDTGGSMGDGLVLQDQPGIIENLKVNSEWLRQNLKGYTSTKNLCIVTGFGESMKPLFNPGDPVIIDRAIKEYMGAFPYFFRIGGKGYIKRIQEIPGRGFVAIPANKEYKEWDITPDMDFEIFGKVIKVWKSEDF